MPACYLNRDSRSGRHFEQNNPGEFFVPYSSPHGYADLAAIFLHGALAANRRNRPAQVLAEAYQKIVVLDPILLGKFRAQRGLGLLRRFGFDIAPAIRYPMNMGVDADAWFLVTKRHN